MALNRAAAWSLAQPLMTWMADWQHCKYNSNGAAGSLVNKVWWSNNPPIYGSYQTADGAWVMHTPVTNMLKVVSPCPLATNTDVECRPMPNLVSGLLDGTSSSAQFCGIADSA